MIQQKIEPVSIKTRIVRLILKALIFPKRVSDKISSYNKRVGIIRAQIDDSSFDYIRANNVKLLNYFIRIPLLVGIILTIVVFLYNKAKIMVYYKVIVLILKREDHYLITNLFKALRFILIKIGILKEIFTGFFFGYVCSFFGAAFLSLHTALKKEDEIKQFLIKKRYVDQDGKPWSITWTNDAIMLTIFNNEPHSVYNDKEFWYTIGFNPTLPKQCKGDLNTVIFLRASELPDIIRFKVSDIKDKSRPTPQVSLSNIEEADKQVQKGISEKNEVQDGDK